MLRCRSSACSQWPSCPFALKVSHALISVECLFSMTLFLGKVPLDPAIAAAAEQGRSLFPTIAEDGDDMGEANQEELVGTDR